MDLPEAVAGGFLAVTERSAGPEHARTAQNVQKPVQSERQTERTEREAQHDLCRLARAVLSRHRHCAYLVPGLDTLRAVLGRASLHLDEGGAAHSKHRRTFCFG